MFILGSLENDLTCLKLEAQSRPPTRGTYIDIPNIDGSAREDLPHLCVSSDEARVPITDFIPQEATAQMLPTAHPKVFSLFPNLSSRQEPGKNENTNSKITT